MNTNNDVLIQLDIRDNKGRRTRVSGLKDIVVKVYTTRPDYYLTFYYTNINQKINCDVLTIRQEEMESLPSGVITYTYTYGVDTNCGCGCETCETNKVKVSNEVITDIYWTNLNYDKLPNSPAYYVPLEKMKEMVNVEREERIKDINDVNQTLNTEIDKINEQYNNYDQTLNDEIVRAKGEESNIQSNVDEINNQFTSHLGQSTKKFDEINKKINDLNDDLTWVVYD